MPASRPVYERFMEKVSMEPMSGCWLWTGALTDNGYGSIGINGQGNYAHRIAYELFKESIPEGLDLDHLCRLRCCVNPAHLEPVTRRTNLLRGDTLTAKYAKRTHCKNGHLLAGDNLIQFSRKPPRQPERRCKSCFNNNRRLQH